MSGLNYKKLGNTFSYIFNTTQLADATKCQYTFKNFWGEPWRQIGPTFSKNVVSKIHDSQTLVTLEAYCPPKMIRQKT